MQDIQSIGYGVRRLFTAGTGGDAGGDGGGGSLKCPRCGCLNTKFCYYNNYNLSQPRFFCKGCRRYWTKGGVLRNVPVGGGCRKTKRSKHKIGDGKPSSTTDTAVVAPNISSETPVESATAILDRCSTDNHQLCSFGSLMTSSSGEYLPLGFISAPERLSLTQVREMEDSLGVVDERSGFEYSRWSNGGGAAEDWGLFDQSYWLNSSDNQLNFLI